MGNEPTITNASTGVTPEQLGGSGPSTDLNTKDFPAGTTGVDNGVPHNIKGQPTSGPAPLDLSGGLVPKEQPPLDLSGGLVEKPPAQLARQDAWNQAGKPKVLGTVN